MMLLALENLSKRYGPVTALDSVSLCVAKGSRTAVVGPSGSGKSTLLRLIAGFERPDVGTISVDGEMLADGPAAVPAHRRGIGIVSQDGALFPHLSVGENIGFGMPRASGNASVERQRLIHELLDMVELDRSMLARRPHQLSGGQQQRVALARALARKPRLMLLDEPFSALDTGLRETMRKAVSRVLQTAGITTILVTHDQGEALSFADQVAVLRDGRLIQCGPPQNLYLQPVDRQTAVFLGDAVMLPATLQDGFANCALGSLRLSTDLGGDIRRTGDVMLRPEQIRIRSDAGGEPSGTAAARGRVVEVEFGGAACTVVVSLDGNDAPPIVIRTTGIDLPQPGDLVRLEVVGGAHLLPAD